LRHCIWAKLPRDCGRSRLRGAALSRARPGWGDASRAGAGERPSFRGEQTTIKRAQSGGNAQRLCKSVPSYAARAEIALRGRARRRCDSLRLLWRILRCRYRRACSPCGPVGWCSKARSDMRCRELLLLLTGAMTTSDPPRVQRKSIPVIGIRRSSFQRQRSDQVGTDSFPRRAEGNRLCRLRASRGACPRAARSADPQEEARSAVSKDVYQLHSPHHMASGVAPPYSHALRRREAPSRTRLDIDPGCIRKAPHP
jgi:hypothetical protein